MSPDGLTYTIDLRKGVKFSDGTGFNADALKLTFDRAIDPKMRVPLRFAIGMVKECVKIDDYTVALKLNYPFAPLAPTLSLTLVSTISPAAIQKYGEEVRQNPVGAGPYVLKEWVKGDLFVIIAKPHSGPCRSAAPQRAALEFELAPIPLGGGKFG